MAIKYTNIFHRSTLKNLPKLVFFGLKTNHLATQELMPAQPKLDRVTRLGEFSPLWKVLKMGSFLQLKKYV
jgi:hypothetical protein